MRTTFGTAKERVCIEPPKGRSCNGLCSASLYQVFLAAMAGCVLVAVIFTLATVCVSRTRGPYPFICTTPFSEEVSQRRAPSEERAL